MKTLDQIKSNIYSKILAKTGIQDVMDIKPKYRLIIDLLAEEIFEQQEEFKKMIEEARNEKK